MFVIICTGIVITVAIGIVSVIFNIFIFAGADDGFCGAWIFTTLGFGVCLTLLLIQNGIIG